MSSSPRTPPASGAFSRRFTAYAGFFFDAFAPNSAWIREQAHVQLPPLSGVKALLVRGECVTHPDARGLETSLPGLRLTVNGRPVAALTQSAPGPWEQRVALPADESVTLAFELTGVGLTNFLAWLGRLTGFGGLQRFRTQNKNRQRRVTTIATEAGEVIFDFSRRDAPYSSEYARRHARLGLNIVGFLTAELGVGESARCMVRAADAAGIPSALVPLKLNCKNRLGDQSYAARLQDDNPHDVNVVHIDPPASRDIDHHHGRGFRAGKYNIAYFAWELPEFPDGWVASFDYFDEIWCPSDFTSAAIALKSPLPVLTMPHAIGFAAPEGGVAHWRARFNLPADAFLFLTLFDLNSYSARKNPRAAIEAFRQAARGSAAFAQEAALVIKVQNATGNEADFAALQTAVRDLPRTVLLTETLSRAEIYGLESACNAFVSLHRSEGFGLAVAECMLLGKPVISTDWSATAEFVNAENGCPVRARLVTLEENHGPYAKGSTWADPDPAHAAEHMRRLFSDRTHAANLGRAARATMQARFAPAVIGARYRRRLESIATF
ncbi:glycosyltransferase family 4 protein [Horticoccus sp. 23ND18S-11]|uniref:glycosyltransferase family 4 protein n=1 Tax=Horticoccus sp. 23ND18S-11 TaxID=3391832 RepID=UPI0039C9F8D5